MDDFWVYIVSKCTREETLLSIDDKKSVDIGDWKGEDSPSQEYWSNINYDAVLHINISTYEYRQK